MGFTKLDMNINTEVRYSTALGTESRPLMTALKFTSPLGNQKMAKAAATNNRLFVTRDSRERWRR
jgi:hypothetical protein